MRTSAATTAKPRPASPARAASIAALSASRLVCSAIALMSSRISPIFWLRSPSESDRSAIVSTFSCMSRIVSPVCSAAPATARALSAIDVAVTANSSIVADVSVIAADCSAVVASASWAAVRRSCATSPSAPIDDRVCTTSALRRASRRLVRRISRSAAKSEGGDADERDQAAEQPGDQRLAFAPAALATLAADLARLMALEPAIGPVTLSSSVLSLASAAFGRSRSACELGDVGVVGRDGPAEQRRLGALVAAERELVLQLREDRPLLLDLVSSSGSRRRRYSFIASRSCQKAVARLLRAVLLVGRHLRGAGLAEGVVVAPDGDPDRGATSPTTTRIASAILAGLPALVASMFTTPQRLLDGTLTRISLLSSSPSAIRTRGMSAPRRSRSARGCR